MPGEPRFDIDCPFGQAGEDEVRDVIGRLRHGRYIEVKRKRRQDNRFYVELEHDPGRYGVYRRSGLSLPDGAGLWAFVVAETEVVVFVPARRLRAAMEHGLGREAAETDGSCPTRGRLLTFGEFIAAELDEVKAVHG